MLVKPHEIIANALNNHFAVGAFNTSNLELTQAIVAAAQKLNSPVIVQTSEGAIEYAGLKNIANIITTAASTADIPVVMHLDHGKSFTAVRDCIQAGYTSVMIDLSKKPLDENIAGVKKVVDYAHERGVWVEAELGAILGAEGAKELAGEKTPDDFLTNPGQVQLFVKETKVDALAVSVGTIHGAFTGQEFIRFELLEEIEEKLPDFPLVIHGASGIPDDNLRKVSTANVCKVNVDTEIRIAFEKAVKAYFNITHDSVDPRKIIGPARDAAQTVVEEKINIFGSAGQAHK